MKSLALFAFATINFIAFHGASANNNCSFVADRYYFEMSYGKAMEFYEEHYLPGSTLWEIHPRSILRIELLPDGRTYQGFKVPQGTPKAKITWNQSNTLGLAAFGEHAVILTPQFHILRVFSNAERVRWISDTTNLLKVERVE